MGLTGETDDRVYEYTYKPRLSKYKTGNRSGRGRSDSENLEFGATHSECLLLPGFAAQSDSPFETTERPETGNSGSSLDTEVALLFF